MEVILLKNVDHLGELGAKVSVRPGYGRNFLIPSGFAVPATAANLKAFEEQRAELEKEAADSQASAEARREKLEGLTLTVARKAGDEGKLFGSVGTQDIAAALEAMGIALKKQEVRLPEGPFRAVGEYEVTLHLHAAVDATIKLEIVPEE